MLLSAKYRKAKQDVSEAIKKELISWIKKKNNFTKELAKV